jgi:predicted transcriptional regulator of viral defense system
MANRDRTDTGEYVETVSVDDVLDVMRTSDDPFVTNRDVANAVGCSSETARRKLTTLAEAGDIERREVGANAVVWWIPHVSELDRRADELWAGEGISFEEWAAEDA